MIVHAEEPSFRDDRFVDTKKPLSQFRHLDAGMGKHHAPGLWHLAMQGRQLRERLLHQLSIPVQDGLRTTTEGGPALERPRREKLGDGGPAHGRVVLHGLEPLEEMRMSDNPSDSQGAEAAYFGHGGQSDHPRSEFGYARRGMMKGELAERLIHEDIAIALLRDVREFLKIVSSKEDGSRVVQVREHEELRSASGRLPKSVDVEGPSVVAIPHDRDDVRTETHGTIAQWRVVGSIHDDAIPWLDQGCVRKEVRLRGPCGHEHTVHRHPRVPRDQPSKWRRPSLIRPVQVQVLGERPVELAEGEALDVRIGNVQADVVDAFVEPKVLERREFHGTVIVTREIKLWSISIYFLE